MVYRYVQQYFLLQKKKLDQSFLLYAIIIFLLIFILYSNTIDGGTFHLYVTVTYYIINFNFNSNFKQSQSYQCAMRCLFILQATAVLLKIVIECIISQLLSYFSVLTLAITVFVQRIDGHFSLAAVGVM